MPEIPRLRVGREVTISIKCKDWKPGAPPMVGFCLRIAAGQHGVWACGQAAVNAPDQTVSCTLKIPQIVDCGNGPWGSELRIAYCHGMNPANGAVPFVQPTIPDQPQPFPPMAVGVGNAAGQGNVYLPQFFPG